jgi:hypothetical protein
MDDEDKIAAALGIRSLKEIEVESDKTETREVSVVETSGEIVPQSQEESSLNSEVLKDIEQAKKNISDIINTGMDSLSEIIEIAKQSEAPRAFEVASTMMKTLLEANKDFIAMSEKKKFAQEEQPISTNTTNVTNNNLILSTSELLKMIKGDG